MFQLKWKIVKHFVWPKQQAAKEIIQPPPSHPQQPPPTDKTLPRL